ncbi:ABC transporter ATP-binding protein [Patescibacteria group bacterium]|nr:ABC transporter ATP-binding protein [Patescibacteria group bacterium]
MNVISIENLKKSFGKTTAVDGISFDVREGEIMGFLGPNGSGKTTTIRCLMDFLRPDEGKIDILGLDAQKNTTELKNDIGHLSSESTLYNSWTGQEHIDFLEKIRGISRFDEELIDNLKFDPRKKIHALSTGNRRKLAVILALMHQPKLLILDEPTVGLDPLLQNYIYEILKDQTAKGNTVFMSSHNLAEVEKVCDRVIVLKEGKIVAIETISALREKKIYTIYAYFEGAVPKKELTTDGAHLIKELPGGLALKVRGDIKPLLVKLSRHKNLKDVEISHASLEEVFMEFYK